MSLLTALGALGRWPSFNPVEMLPRSSPVARPALISVTAFSLVAARTGAGGAVSSARALEQKRPAGTHMSQSSPSGSGLDRGGGAVSSARALEQKRPAGTRITQSSPSGKRSREPPPPNHPPPARPNRSRRPHPAAPGCIPPRSTATTDAARLARGPTAVWTRTRNGGARELLCRHSPVGQLDGVRAARFTNRN